MISVLGALPILGRALRSGGRVMSVLAHPVDRWGMGLGPVGRRGDGLTARLTWALYRAAGRVRGW